MKENLTIVLLSDKRAAVEQWLRWYQDVDYSRYKIVICETNRVLEYKHNLTVPVNFLCRDINQTQLINQAIDEADTKFVMLTHVNVRPEPQMIHHLISSLVLNRNIAAVSPYISFMGKDHFSGTYLHGFQSFNFIKLSLTDKDRENGLYPTDSVTRECMMFKKHDWKLIGKLDPNFHGVYDDYDWSSRAKEIGFILGVNYNTKISTLGFRKPELFRRKVSEHLWVKRNCSNLHFIIDFFKTIGKNFFFLFIDILRLKPINFINRTRAVYAGYLRSENIPDINEKS